MVLSHKQFPIGKSDFASLREGNYYYVDKSFFIEEVIQEGAEILLIPRPRRFGKTLNLSMLRYFFEKSKEDRRELFKGLAIEKSEEAWKHFQKYPVIFLTFKDVKANRFEDAWTALAQVLCKLYKEHDYLLEGSFLSKEEATRYHHLLAQTATPAQCFDALSNLSRYLHIMLIWIDIE